MALRGDMARLDGAGSRCGQLGLPMILGVLPLLPACHCGSQQTPSPPALAAAPAAASSSGEDHPPQNDAGPPVRWTFRTDVAQGEGYAGPWRMNDSKFFYVDDPAVAVTSKGTFFVAWVDNRRQDVFFRAYSSGGEPLDDPVAVSRNPDTFSWLPRLAITADDQPLILWQEIIFTGGSHGGDALFARSTDGGRSFEPPVNLSSRSRAGDGKGQLTNEIWDNGSLDLEVAPDGSILAAWTAYQGPLWVSRSTDGGVSFSTPLQVAGRPHEPARGPSLAAAEDGRVELAWTVGVDNRADIHLASSSDGGRSFAAPEIVAPTSGHSDAPDIALAPDGSLHLVHGEAPAGMFQRYHVRYLRRAVSGTWSPPRILSGDDAGHFPTIATDHHGRIAVVWEHYRDVRPPPEGLGFTMSTDGGERFSAPFIVPGTGADLPGVNGSQQGYLIRKLDLTDGVIGIVNSGFAEGESSTVRLVAGVMEDR